MQLSRFFRNMTRGLAPVALLALFAASPALRAQQTAASPATNDHLVSPSQLQQQTQAVTTTRQKEVDNLSQFLSTPAAEQAMKSAKVDPVQVRTAIPTLSDAELANLSARATHAQNDFSAGVLGTRTLVIIILVIVVIILVSIYH